MEAAALDRKTIAADLNPYAVLLTEAKLARPNSLDEGLRRLREVWLFSRDLLPEHDLRSVPKWVRRFFHPKTLKSALAFRDACIIRNDSFLLANLLGILHHQRPGFLSYPSSNLVPYLRDKKFPKESYPDLYKERSVLPRLEAKVRRTLKRIPARAPLSFSVRLCDAREFPLQQQVHAVITSPPYMNGLDYIRDNRLRIWFLEKTNPSQVDLGKRDCEKKFEELLRQVARRVSRILVPGGYLAMVLGEVKRSGISRHTAAVATRVLSEICLHNEYKLVKSYIDEIPQARRSRQEFTGCKSEVVLIYRRR